MPRRVKTVSYSMPPELADALETRAAAVGISRSSYLTMLLSSMLSRPFVLEAVETEAENKGGLL